MAFKFERNHRDYLFWIYPLIILGILIFALKRDELKGDSFQRTGADVKVDTSVTISLKNEVIDSLKVPEKKQDIPLLLVLR
jgi:hypothetical protein